jgi:hypothetical protein
MQKTKKVKRQNKGEHGKKKRIFTIKNKGGVWNPFNRTAKVAPLPQPYSPVPSVPSPIRSRPSSIVNNEGSMFRDVPDTTTNNSMTTDSHDTRFDMGDIYPLKEEVKDQHISPGSALTMSPAARQPLTDPRTLAQMNMIQQNRQPASLQSTTTSSTTPPNDKCLLYISSWLQNRDMNHRISTKNAPTINEYNAFVNDMESKKRLTQSEIDACLQYSGITSHLYSSLGSTTSTQGTGSTEYSTVVPDTITTNSSSTNSDKTYIIKYKTVNGTPQEKEVFVQDPTTQTYTRYLFDMNEQPKKCPAQIIYNKLGNHLNGSIQTTGCDISLKPLGSVN